MPPLLRKLFSPTGFALGILCFVLPFVSVSCEAPAGSFTATVSGVDIVTGGDPSLETTGMFAADDEDSVESETTEDNGDYVGAQLLAIASVGFLVIALVLAVVRRSSAVSLSAAGAGALGAGLLIGSVVSYRESVKDAINSSAEESGDSLIDPGMITSMMQVETRYGFWLALLFVVVATAALVAERLWPGMSGAQDGPPPPAAGFPPTGAGPNPQGPAQGTLPSQEGEGPVDWERGAGGNTT